MHRYLVAIIFAMAGLNQAQAMCDEGLHGPCMIRGKPGNLECVGGRPICIPDEAPPPSDPPQTGILGPRYFVLAVIYAPPGTNGGNSTSSVSYASGSTTGTTTSTTKSFKQAYSVSTSGSVGIGVLGTGSLNLSFSYSHSAGDTNSLDVSKSTTSTITAGGPASDGIDHDHDQIYLWLNPKIALTVNSNSAAWSFAGTGQADVQYVYVAWLKDPSLMPTGVRQMLQSHGLTAQDFTDILKRDPFAVGMTNPDPARFMPLNTTLPYEPPLSASDPVPTTSFNVTYAATATNSSTVEDDYTVAVTVETTGSYFGLATASLQAAGSWNWTNSSTMGNSAAATQSASLTVGGPAFGYNGPTELAVYYDRVYRSFSFHPVDPSQRSLQGKLISGAGAPTAWKEVDAVANGVTYRTFTNAKGEYRFYGPMTGPIMVESSGASLTIPRPSPGSNVDLRVR